LLAEHGNELVGGLTYAVAADVLEIVTINAARSRNGIGTALLTAVERVARELHCARIVSTTTNDNLDALRFYQRRGYRLTGLRRGAVDSARRIKPEIPSVGEYEIPIVDELELSRQLREQAPPSFR